MKYLVDAYAWIEYFEGSPRGLVLKRLIDAEETIIISDSTFGEVYSYAARKGYDGDWMVAYMRSHAHIYETYTNIWVEAAGLREQLRKKRPNFGIMDALLLAVQQVTGATIVTGDRHFKGMKKVRML